ncbi:hypothetical protein CEXT_814761 [Caerostris extrusa]|uniref:Uncharacterized protein n=1 Tax=Caerostris extrusa TaxID=172846 RepID=A0AAV4RVS2_CAEEX|nr:hypothetical protein CEXT_814761 [Caerostris extrusa]
MTSRQCVVLGARISEFVCFLLFFVFPSLIVDSFSRSRVAFESACALAQREKSMNDTLFSFESRLNERERKEEAEVKHLQESEELF